MRMPRVSITGIMVAAVVIALDCATVRAIMSRPGALIGDLLEKVFCAIPMANAVAVGLAALIGRRGRDAGFHRGFVLGGGIALAAILGLMTWRMEWITAYAMFVATMILRVTGWDVMSAGEVLIILALIPPFFILPQFLLAWALGRASLHLSRRSAEAPEAASTGRRRGLLPLAALLILVAAPPLAIEMYLRREVDSTIARFAADSRAFVDLGKAKIPGPNGTRFFPSGLLDPARPPLPDGTAVRIVEDREPPVIQAWAIQQVGGVSETNFSDLRPVRVTLLDGAEAGQTRSVPYFMLRTTR